MKEKMKILLVLQKRLNGRCKDTWYCCPKSIVDGYGWCDWCQENFNWLRKDTDFQIRCPCNLKTSKGEVIQHLDDIIEEMKENENESELAD